MPNVEFELTGVSCSSNRASQAPTTSLPLLPLQLIFLGKWFSLASKGINEWVHERMNETGLRKPVTIFNTFWDISRLNICWEYRCPCFCLHVLPSALQGWEKPALMGTLQAFPSWADSWPSAVLSKVSAYRYCVHTMYFGPECVRFMVEQPFNHWCQKEQTIVKRAKWIPFKGLESLP